jgi:hypothetical protein
MSGLRGRPVDLSKHVAQRFLLAIYGGFSNNVIAGELEIRREAFRYRPHKYPARGCAFDYSASLMGCNRYAEGSQQDNADFLLPEPRRQAQMASQRQTSTRRCPADSCK